MFFSIFIELVIGYISLFILVKLLGKTQLSQITPFDFISALVLGEFVGSAIFDRRTDTFEMIFGIIVWGLLIYITEVLTQKSRSMRHFFEGRPSMVINKGNLDWKEMKKNQIDIDQLQQLLRLKGVFSLQDVEYAILENNGDISVLLTANADQPTCKDLNIKGEKRDIPLTIISDGVILENNLKKAGKEKDWLYNQIIQKGIEGPDKISYAEYHNGKELFIQKYNT